MVGQRHQLRLEGWVQLSLLFRGKGQQVAMVDSQSQEVILTKMLQKTLQKMVKTSYWVSESLNMKFR